VYFRAWGRPTSTVSREVDRNEGAQRYRAVSAHGAARRRARRPKVRKLVADHKLARLVAYKLKREWSPEQIAAYLHQRYAEPHKGVSHETIYQCLYLQGRGGLRTELRKALRTGRAQRRPTDRERKTPVRIPDMVLISERPAEIEDRAVPGHWEGDLIIGKDSKSQVGTLVERSTRFVMWSWTARRANVPLSIGAVLFDRMRARHKRIAWSRFFAWLDRSR